MQEGGAAVKHSYYSCPLIANNVGLLYGPIECNSENAEHSAIQNPPTPIGRLLR